MYLYVYVYVYTYIYVYIYMCIYIFTYVCIHTYNIHIYTHICMHIYISMYPHFAVFWYVLEYVFVHKYIYTQHTYTRIYIHTHAFRNACIETKFRYFLTHNVGQLTVIWLSLCYMPTDTYIFSLYLSVCVEKKKWGGVDRDLVEYSFVQSCATGGCFAANLSSGTSL